MFDIFSTKIAESERKVDFSYLQEGNFYFDSACQTLRPDSVIAAQQEYYEHYNACGGRVKYPWGERVDREVEEARTMTLRYVQKSSGEYAVSFTQSTTYGINLILSQLKRTRIQHIVTTDREHNSVFLPTMTYAAKNDWIRHVISRNETGGVDITCLPKEPTLFIANLVSNIDGQICTNIQEISSHVHRYGGMVIVDGAQAMTQPDLLKNVDFDALCFSGHKMYAPSLGVIIYKKTLLQDIDLSFIGGGMVESVTKNEYALVQGDPSALLEPGLQDWAAIVGFKAALSWLSQKKSVQIDQVQKSLWNGLQSLPLHVLGGEKSMVFSFYGDQLDSHRAAQALATRGIMTRSGYFCCHYYLKEVLQLPPLLRISLGYHNTEEDVRHLISSLSLLYK